MAEWKIDITQAVKDTAERALDEYQYKGHTIREWADKITSGKYQEVKRGWWRANGICSRCGYFRQETRSGNYIVGNYCPKCGAKMAKEAVE